MLLGRQLFSSSRFLPPLPSRTMSSSPPKLIHFGPFEVTNQVFYNAATCYALVNIKPILPGHVLVIPYRPAQRLTDLSPDEVTDLFTTVQKVQRMLARTYFTPPSTDAGRPEGGSFNIAIQDGKESGQTVPHVHCHVIPRLRGNELGDGIYDLLQGEEGNVGGGLWDLARRPGAGGKFPRVEDEDREPRGVEVMREEAAFYRRQMALVDGEGS